VKENYEENLFLAILFHNLKNYDAHFVLKHFEKKYVERHGEDGSVSFDGVEVTPQNSEKYLQFQIGYLRFLDSFQFLSTSLEELVSLLLKSGKDNFVHTKAHLGTDNLCQGRLPLFICRFVREIRRNSTTVDKRNPRQLEKRTVVGGGLSASARHVTSFRL